MRARLHKLLVPALLMALGVAAPNAWADASEADRSPAVEADPEAPPQVDPEPAAPLLPPAQGEVRASARYVSMGDEEVFAELDRRGVPYTRVEEPLPGIKSPVRLTGPLHGVLIHSSLPEEKRAASIFEVLDARLALALDDFTALLERHDIVEIVHYTMYRPNGLPPGFEIVHDEPEDEPPPPAKGASGRASGKGPVGKATKRGAKATSAKRTTAKKLEKKAATKRKPKSGLGKGAKEPKEARAQDRKQPIKQKSGPDKKSPAEKKPAAKKAPEKKAVEKKAVEKKPAPKKAAVDKKALDKKALDKKALDKKALDKKALDKKSRDKKDPDKKNPGKKAAVDKKADKKGARRKKAEPVEQPVKVVSYAPPGTRHPAGLAIDVGQFKKRDGRWLNVAQHFHGHIGMRTCGMPPSGIGQSEQNNELWAIACESVALGFFTYVLTPNYNADHRDHFHMEIRPNVSWYWVR